MRWCKHSQFQTLAMLHKGVDCVYFAKVNLFMHIIPICIYLYFIVKTIDESTNQIYQKFVSRVGLQLLTLYFHYFGTS